MSKSEDGKARGKYTLEFKMQALRLVKGGQAVPATAKILVGQTRGAKRLAEFAK